MEPPLHPHLLSIIQHMHDYRPPNLGCKHISTSKIASSAEIFGYVYTAFP